VDIAEACNVHPHINKGRCREVEIAKSQHAAHRAGNPQRTGGSTSVLHDVSDERCLRASVAAGKTRGTTLSQPLLVYEALSY
jgi:hypothetical protein